MDRRIRPNSVPCHGRGMERAAGMDPGLAAVTRIHRVHTLVQQPAHTYIRTSQSRGWEEV